MDRIGAVVGGIIGYVLGLFFKSLVPILILFKLPSFYEYLVETFVPTSGISTPEFIRFFTVPVPFALLGVAIGVVMLRSRSGAKTVALPES